MAQVFFLFSRGCGLDWEGLPARFFFGLVCVCGVCSVCVLFLFSGGSRVFCFEGLGLWFRAFRVGIRNLVSAFELVGVIYFLSLTV